MMLANQRLAFRIARREALRYKGRSVLSITLLGLPLLAVAIGATAYDTAQLSKEETAEQYLGANDAYIEFAIPGVAIEQLNWDDRWISYDVPSDAGFEEAPERDVPDTEILAALPDGTRLAPYSPQGGVGTALQAATGDGIASVQGYGYDLSDDLYANAGIEFLAGAAPGDGETVLNEAAADLLGLGVGDDLVVEGEGGPTEMPVSGIVEVPWNLNEPMAIADSFETEPLGWLVDTPGTLTKDQALGLNELGLTVWAGSLLDEPPAQQFVQSTAPIDQAELMIYGLIVVAVVMEVVLLAGPAFAISAKRRTREFALMSANGATAGQIRSVVLAGGVLFGLIAAVAAIAIGVGVVAAATPWLEGVLGYRSAGLRVMPGLQASLVAVAIATGLLSALTAAISASRVNVVAALMGRAGRRSGSKRWMVVGVAMVAAGIASGLGGVALWSLPLMAAAIVLAQLGLVTCTPALLALAAKLGRWMPLAPRMALREAGRNRGSAAPAIAAVLGVVAAGMAFSMIAAATEARSEQEQERDLPQGTMTLTLINNGGSDVAVDWDAVLAEVEPRLRTRLDDLELTPVPEYSGWGGCGVVTAGPGQDVDCQWTAVRPEENRCPYWSADISSEEAEQAAVEAAREDPRCDETLDPAWAYVDNVAGTTDPAVIAAYTDLEGAELDSAVDVLERGGVIVADEWAVTDGKVALQQQITIWDDNGGSSEPQDTFLELRAIAVDKGQLGINGMLLSPAAAEAMGMELSPWQREYLVSTSTEPESADLESLAASLNQDFADGTARASFEVVDYTDPFVFYFVIAVTGLCALVALGATAVSTGLIVAEQRRDMSTLGAIGAAPSLRKRFAMWQTVVIAVFGAGLGTVAGFIGYALIRETLNRPLQFQYPFAALYGWELPWASFAIMLIAVPLTAALGAVVFTRATLPSERRLT